VLVAVILVSLNWAYSKHIGSRYLTPEFLQNEDFRENALDNAVDFAEPQKGQKPSVTFKEVEIAAFDTELQAEEEANVPISCSENQVECMTDEGQRSTFAEDDLDQEENGDDEAEEENLLRRRSVDPHDEELDKPKEGVSLEASLESEPGISSDGDGQEKDQLGKEKSYKSAIHTDFLQSNNKNEEKSNTDEGNIGIDEEDDSSDEYDNLLRGHTEHSEGDDNSMKAQEEEL